MCIAGTYQPKSNDITPCELRGHEGADFFIIKSFVEAILVSLTPLPLIQEERQKI